MSPETQPQRVISVTLPGHHLRKYAQLLLNLHLRLNPSASNPRLGSDNASSDNANDETVRIVCVSDTHNNKPNLPPGDVLIHAGDLTENGSFDELQAQLNWLSAQPHAHKIVVAGNHDVLLDEGFLEKYPERRYGDVRTRKDLEWGGLVYLEDESVTLNFPRQNQRGRYGQEDDDRHGAQAAQHAHAHENNPNQRQPELQTQSESERPEKTRGLKIYGSPQTPQYGISAFQYPSSSAEEVWSNRIPDDADIVVVHGPPRLHLDSFDPNGLRRSGCAHLNQEIHRVRPRLVVFGHIHVGHGREDVLLDGVRQGHEKVMNRLGGWGVILGTVWAVILGYLKRVLGVRLGEQRVTTFVNAAVVGGGLKNELRNEAVIVDI
ncbi:metallophosphatase domain-containing protein [Aspergillus mulundensis]|uniref:Calcineurin-like phosphoesterase domain-containing protein n=1 Tax=Aspergillus mulundensis TaxID=1810919 RepID=A0A3D8QFA5_9EURO|nr:hypothetical protein DSM5745_10967 [Aspergillus mulundensis]RDW60509.1 hypothetical protein DSM5745_10967 [Aspergillus mulundensis]